MKWVLLGLFFDGVAGVEAEEAAADLHDAALPLCLLLLSADDAKCPPESSQFEMGRGHGIAARRHARRGREASPRSR